MSLDLKLNGKLLPFILNINNISVKLIFLHQFQICKSVISRFPYLISILINYYVFVFKNALMKWYIYISNFPYMAIRPRHLCIKLVPISKLTDIANYTDMLSNLSFYLNLKIDNEIIINQLYFFICQIFFFKDCKHLRIVIQICVWQIK